MSEREILFRGKRVDNGEWVEGYYFRQYGSNEIVTADDEQYHIFPNTVGQYTGLTDKNGTRIFEGDVIKHRGENFIVYWDEECAGFYPFYDQDNPIGYGVIGEESEVIGNIHDNPELLKGE